MIHLDKFVGPDDAALVFVGERGGTPKRGSWRTTVKWTKRVAEAGLPKGSTLSMTCATPVTTWPR
jgi:hypothetical protein